FDPADAGVVGCVDEHVSQLRIRGNTSPVGAADRSWKDHTRHRGSARCTKHPRTKWSFVIERAAASLNQVAAGLGVRVGGGLGGDEILHLEAHPAKGRWLYRYRLRWRTVLPWHFADRNGFLFDAENRFAGDAIENVQVPDFAGLREDWNLLSLHR